MVAAAGLGVVVGAVQVVILLGFLSERRPNTNAGADRGFGSNPNLVVELAWLLGLLSVSAMLVSIALAWLRIRWYLLVMPVVLGVELAASSRLGSGLPADTDWRLTVALAVLAVELMSCVLLLPQRDTPGQV
jgi:hypothetical protein